MVNEIEVKILEVNVDKLSEKLERLGAKKVFDNVLLHAWEYIASKSNISGSCIACGVYGTNFFAGLCSVVLGEKNNFSLLDDVQVYDNKSLAYDNLCSILEGAGLKHVKEVKALGGQFVKVYDFSDGKIDFSNKTFRVRREGEKTVLCHKQRKKDSVYKINAETEVFVSDCDLVRRIIHSLGFVLDNEKQKIRRSYSLGNIHFDIDQYPKIPALVEVEATSPELVERGVNLIGYNMGQTTKKSGNEVLRDYGLPVDKKPFILRF